ncbi:hypothetical protein ILYODFUR_017823 [Ilyodon furcidens]|uniref:C-type lectin domain-containing protein n=1 Tax=Ilyodon furcidens TaxID=33524 RepID=A0ABV0TVK0_9TELE
MPFPDLLILSTCLLHQYQFIDQSLTWTEAQTYCRRTYTDLATIDSSEELKQLLNTLSSAGHMSEIWIGLYSEIIWRWSDGFTQSKEDYKNWNTSDDEPDFISANQFCVLMDNYGKWWDINCNHSHRFICYNGTQLGSDFVLVNKTMIWSSAQRFCRENYINLATVRNDTENQRVRSLLSSGYIAWIGMLRDPNFYWSDGSSVLFTTWDDVSNPIRFKRVICGTTSVQRSGLWRFRSCQKQLQFVCYSSAEPVRKQVVKLRLKMEDSMDLNDPVLKANILKNLQDRLTDNRMSGVTLKWREQRDGEVLHKERKRKQTEF